MRTLRPSTADRTAYGPRSLGKVLDSVTPTTIGWMSDCAFEWHIHNYSGLLLGRLEIHQESMDVQRVRCRAVPAIEVWTGMSDTRKTKLWQNYPIARTRGTSRGTSSRVSAHAIERLGGPPTSLAFVDEKHNTQFAANRARERALRLNRHVRLTSVHGGNCSELFETRNGRCSASGYADLGARTYWASEECSEICEAIPPSARLLTQRTH